MKISIWHLLNIKVISFGIHCQMLLKIAASLQTLWRQIHISEIGVRLTHCSEAGGLTRCSVLGKQTVLIKRWINFF